MVHQVSCESPQQHMGTVQGVRHSSMLMQPTLCSPCCDVIPLPLLPLQDFAQCLGSGGLGAVYRGTLQGTPVAVKVLHSSVVGPDGSSSSSSCEVRAAFTREVTALSQVRHPHMVCLMGACPEGYMLVYELMEGGNLEEALFDDSRAPLLWQVRHWQGVHAECSSLAYQALWLQAGWLSDTDADTDKARLPHGAAWRTQAGACRAHQLLCWEAQCLCPNTVHGIDCYAWCGPVNLLQERVRIAAEVAAALEYMHNARPPLVHLDVRGGKHTADKAVGGQGEGHLGSWEVYLSRLGGTSGQVEHMAAGQGAVGYATKTWPAACAELFDIQAHWDEARCSR
jgi:hypothetical protein